MSQTHPDTLNLRTVQSDDLTRLAPHSLFDLSGRVAVVTGASGGLGSWLSAGLAAAGASVVASDRPESPVDEIVETINQGGGNASALKEDLTQRDAPRRIVDATIERYGRLDIVVNNAGVNRREPIFDVSDESWDLISTMNLRVPYELSRAAAQSMKSAGTPGSIIHIGSLNNAIGLEGVSVYGAHKAALCQLAKSQTVEWTPYDIRINVICPGFMLTPLSKPLWEDPVRGQWITRRSPLRRPGYPEELLGACLLLASDAGSFITGQVLYVDGGWLAGTQWTDSVG